MRALPDPDLSLRDALDYIYDCNLCRRALSDPYPKDLALLIREIAVYINKLTISCHLPEFTDHGLTHICSLLNRISSWTSDYPPGTPQKLVERLSPEECARLVLAVMFHDIGMLSQRPDDLPQPTPTWATKSLNDVPNWVRSTHILRMEGVVKRGLASRSFTTTSSEIQNALKIAQAHGSWAWETPFLVLDERNKALAAILAISDLLDEDSNRCDSSTLLNHRYGSELNKAHWIRHGLTNGRVSIDSDVITVDFISVPDMDPSIMLPVFAALRNHFRLALIYKDALRTIKIHNLTFKFNPSSGPPLATNPSLQNWNNISSFGTPSGLCFQLMKTFFPISLLQSENMDSNESSFALAQLEPVNLTHFRAINGQSEPRSLDEQIARSLLS